MDGLKMKEFDLEAAKAGARVTTEQGYPVRIICFDRKNNISESPIVALVSWDDGYEVVRSYDENGEYVRLGDLYPSDLMMETDDQGNYIYDHHRAYANICVSTGGERKAGKLHGSAEDAQANAETNAIAVAELTWKEE